METNKELIAQLREYASNSGYSHTDYADTMRDAAAVLAEQDDAAPEQRWIDADIAKPAQSQAVLVDSTWGVRLAYRHEPSWAKGCFQDAISRSDEGMTDFDGHCKGVFKVKRWMPLPSATLPTAAPVALSDAEPRESQTLATLRKSLAGWQDEAEAMRNQRDTLRQLLDLQALHQKNHIWYWQGDGTDYPESFGNSMAIVIRGDQLRAILAAATQPKNKEQQ